MMSHWMSYWKMKDFKKEKTNQFRKEVIYLVFISCIKIYKDSCTNFWQAASDMNLHIQNKCLELK